MDTSHFLESLLHWNASPLCVNKKTMQYKKHNNLFCSSFLLIINKKTFSDEKWKMIRHGRSWRYSNLDNNQPSASLSARSRCNSSNRDKLIWN